jgi:carbon monoxide dehydrogenase subunit G
LSRPSDTGTGEGKPLQIQNEFEVDAPVDEAWLYLLDVTKVARCMPGAQLTETVDETTWKGTVGIKLGPVSMTFAGTVTLTDRDDATHHVVLKADGREQRGRGAASAAVTADLQPVDSRTKVAFTTDLTITGAAAQYGRGMIQDISSKLTGQFASCLQTNMAAERSAPAERSAAFGPSESSAPAPAPESASGPETPAAAPASAAPVKGVRLGLWAMWRAVVRWFRRLLGRAPG